ncbi:MAG: hypothetical protein KC733_08030 [Candidatus Omnitrophica bacterium]|nr:hypothetical protein [Candidatus Omnitrophota bacterium]
MIKINIKTISEEGIEIDDAIAVEEFGFAEDDYLKFIQPLSVHAKIKKYEDTLLADIKVKSRYRSFCSRSLEKVERDWQECFTLDFPIESTTEFVEISEDIRQEVITRLPVRVLSDKEMQKEEQEQEVKQEPPSVDADTYQPFANLKLKKESHD